jgi:hypothetical protein
VALTKKRFLVAKIEGVYGTDSLPTGAQAIQCNDLSITPLESDLSERGLLRPFLGASEKLTAAARVKIEATVELTGSGAAGTVPNVDALLRACGMAAVTTAGVSVAYNPVSGAFESATLYFNQDGLLHKCTGSRGTWSIDMKTKAIPTLKFSMTGIYSPVVDAAAPASVYSGVQTPVIVGAATTVSLHGFAGAVESLNINLGVNVAYRELINNSKSIAITDRASDGDITLEMPTVAAKDWFAAVMAVNTGPLSVVHGSVAGNIVQIDGPKVSVNSPSYSDSDGNVMLKMNTLFVPNVGNDEIKLIFR